MIARHNRRGYALGCRCPVCSKAASDYARALRKRHPDMANHAREQGGCIVTLRHRETGELHTRHVEGAPEVRLPRFLDRFDPAVYAVQTISTVRTIQADLRMRPSFAGPVPKLSGFGYDPQSPERTLLSRIGRFEYL